VSRFTKIVQRPRVANETPTARVAIRNFCLACMGWDCAAAEVEGCTSPNCWLYPWRLGKTPIELKSRKRVAAGRLRMPKRS